MFAKKQYPRGKHAKSISSQHRDSKQSAERPVSSVTNNSVTNYGSPLVSPLQMTFDFELPPSRSASPFRVSTESFVRPKTSDGSLAAPTENRNSGIGAAAATATSGLSKSAVSLAPPVLPPIPRVASTNGSLASKESRQHILASEEGAKQRDESDNISISSRASASRRKSRNQISTPTTEHPVDLLPPLARPTTSGGASMQEAHRPWTVGETADGNGEPRMTSSIFPSAPRPDSPQLPEIDTGPAMTREFIDSRDRPYSTPVVRPAQNSETAPHPVGRGSMLSVQTQNANAFWRNRGTLGSAPVSPALPTPASATSLRAPKISGARLSPNASVEDLRAVLQRAPSTTTTVTAPLSAQDGFTSTQRKPSRSSEAKAPSPSTPSALTIGTPYRETSPAFPLPQHVTTRPKTAGATATVAGISVPTHHTSSRPTVLRTESGNSAPQVDKAERRKTRLLNPLALLTRRKSGQDGVVVDKSAAAQAYARQKSVAAVGVSELPTDYVGIKGKVVHDFSAPKPTRGLSYETGNEKVNSPLVERQLRSSSSVPYVPVEQTDIPLEPSYSHAQQRSDGSSGGVRRSVHSPVFREMLAEDPSEANRVSSLNAERLENKDFLSRVSQNSSHTSKFSQESAVLPPFARRSQQFNLDPMQASLYNDAESKRSSDQSTSGRGERDSGGSSVMVTGPAGTISPITARSSHVQPAGSGEARSSLGMQSMSPVSPAYSTSPDMSGKRRTMPAISTAAADAQSSGAGLDASGRDSGKTNARPFSGDSAQPNMTPVAEDTPWSSRERSPYLNIANAHEAASTLPSGISSSLALPPSSSSHSLAPSIAVPDRTSSLGTTPEQTTPEISQAEFVRPVSTIAAGGVKVVEKRASAVGHAKRSSLKPKHQASVASRFSFQFGGESAAEEEKLEEKHRKIKGKSQDLSRSRSPDEDDDDDFDEDAMDDMDEFEVQQQHDDPPYAMSANAPWTHSNSPIGLLGVQQGMRVAHSDDGSAYSEEEDDGDAVLHPGWKPAGSEQTYADHPDFMAHYRSGSKATIMTYGSALDHYLQAPGNHGQSQLTPGSHERDKSTASALTINTDILGTSKAPVPVAPGQDFYTQPQAAGYPMPAVSGPPSLPPREIKESKMEERKSRRISGVSLSSPKSQEYRASRISSLNAAGAEREQHDKFHSTSSGGGSEVTGPMPRPMDNNTGLGLSGFQGFKFSDDSTESLVTNRMGSPGIENQRPQTRHGEAAGGSGGWAELAKHISTMKSQQPVSGNDTKKSGFATQAKASTSSPGGLSKAYQGSVGKHIRARNKKVDQNLQYAQSDSEGDDDMYFDDGGFEQEIRNPVHHRAGQIADEDKLDEDGYLPRMNQHAPGPRHGGPALADMGGYHQRDHSGFSIASLASDGPYPSFAMGANPVKAKVRESQMLLEDLPLQAPADPKLIPQRNPSEDAKRLGLSDRVPPLPVQESGDAEMVRRMQTNLAAYHAALAEAANRAQEEGRFARMPSTASTAVSGSFKAKQSFDDRSFYSQDDGAGRLAVGREGEVSRSASNLTRGSEAEGSKTSEYSPPKMSFDFGFDDSRPQQKDAMTFLDDRSFIEDFGTDDDIVAAANAEALANDEDGFYGSEFGFYAKARLNSADAEAINGGFFGENGDDGLARNRSGKEPNLTPITERSEFSTRNSFINLGHGGAFGPASAGLYGPGMGPGSPALARMPVTPIVPENDVANFDQLRKLRANAFGGSNGSLRSAASHGRNNGSTSSNAGLGVVGSPNSTRSPIGGQGYFGPMGGTPMAYGYSDHGSSHSGGSGSNPSSAHPSLGGGMSGFQSDGPPSRAWMPHQDNSSPRSSSSGLGTGQQQQFSSPLANAFDFDATPRKAPPPEATRKVPPLQQQSGDEARTTHSRKGSDSVTYVKEKDPAGSGKPQWVLERRRTGEQGQMELVGREVVQGGWI